MRKIIFYKQSNCTPCVEAEPLIDQLAAKYDVTYEKINLDDASNIDAAVSLGVVGTPAVIIMDENGNKIHLSNNVNQEILNGSLSQIIEENLPVKKDNNMIILALVGLFFLLK